MISVQKETGIFSSATVIENFVFIYLLFFFGFYCQIFKHIHTTLPFFSLIIITCCLVAEPIANLACYQRLIAGKKTRKLEKV